MPHPEREALRLITAPQAWSLGALPMRMESHYLRVALCEPLDPMRLEALRFLTGYDVVAEHTSRECLRNHLESYYGPVPEMSPLIQAARPEDEMLRLLVLECILNRFHGIRIENDTYAYFVDKEGARAAEMDWRTPPLVTLADIGNVLGEGRTFIYWGDVVVKVRGRPISNGVCLDIESVTIPRHGA